MKECVGCHIKFNTNYKKCPLCNNELIGADNSYYPKYKTKKISLPYKIILFVSILIIIIVSFIDCQINYNLTWSIYIDFCLILNLFIEYYIFKDRDRVLNKLSRWGLLATLFALILYLFRPHQVIISVIIPLVSIIEILYSGFLIFILRKNYIKNLIININVSLIPLSIFIFQIQRSNLFYYILFIIIIMIILSLIIFKKEETILEIKKIFRL